MNHFLSLYKEFFKLVFVYHVNYRLLIMIIDKMISDKMWHSRRKSTFRHKNTKMSYLYHVVAFTLLYLLVLVALQSMLLFPSYKGKWVDL